MAKAVVIKHLLLNFAIPIFFMTGSYGQIQTAKVTVMPILLSVVVQFPAIVYSKFRDIYKGNQWFNYVRALQFT